VLTPAAQRAQSQPWKIVGFSIYGFTLVNLFVCSTLHHGLEGPPAMERGLRIADYCAIYPLIAGV
jgi:hemolysin III